jgi:flavin reductase (DIM6/NTAB) family NADH-FMN oxidoreductase RutF
MIEPRKFRDAVGRFGTGVTIVTARDAQGTPVGMTANSFTSVSLDPPLVLFCPARTAESYVALSSGGPFVINVLSEAQQALSNRFARTSEDKWRELAFDTWDSGAPVLRDCLANLECETHAVHEAGDHAVVIGRVIRLGQAEGGRPLLYFGGRYAVLATAGE